MKKLVLLVIILVSLSFVSSAYAGDDAACFANLCNSLCPAGEECPYSLSNIVCPHVKAFHALELALEACFPDVSIKIIEYDQEDIGDITVKYNSGLEIKIQSPYNLSFTSTSVKAESSEEKMYPRDLAMLSLVLEDCFPEYIVADIERVDDTTIRVTYEQEDSQDGCLLGSMDIVFP